MKVKNKLHVEQLSLSLSFGPVMKQPKIVKQPASLQERFGIVRYGQLQFSSSEQLYAAFRKVADYVYRNGEWNDNDLLDSAFEVAKFTGFPYNAKSISKGIISTTYSMDRLDILRNRDIAKVIQVSVKLPDEYHRFIYVTDDKRLLRRSGQILRVNTKDDRRFLRFIFQSRKRLLGYGKLIKDIESIYKNKASELTFEFSALREVLEELIDSTYSQQDYAYLFQTYREGKLSKEEFLAKHDTLDGWNALRQHNAVINFLVNYLRSVSNLAQQARYDTDIEERTRAAAWETKKNINVSTQKLMADSVLNHLFAGLEIDNEVIPENFRLFENEIKRVLPLLPVGSSKPVIRLRKLGNYHAYGMYVPRWNNIVLDFRDERQIAAFSHAGIKSFIHEYGHYLDHQYGKQQLSLKRSFADILALYQQRIDQVDKEKLKNSPSYYKTPTEVFARLFELYVASLGLQTKLLKSPADYQQAIEYSVVDRNLMIEVINYFEHIFPLLRSSIKGAVLS